jgi:hypothetical protein
MPITRYSLMFCSQIIHWFTHQSNYHNNSSFKTFTIQTHDWERFFHTKRKPSTLLEVPPKPPIPRMSSSLLLKSHHSQTMLSYI